MDEDEDKDKMRVTEQGNFLKKRLEKCRGTPQVCYPEGYPLRVRADPCLPPITGNYFANREDGR